MEWYFVVIITLMVYWLIGTICCLFKEEICMYWAVGLVGALLVCIFYPINALRVYKGSYIYYQKRGISKWQYLFGKRVKED